MRMISVDVALGVPPVVVHGMWCSLGEVLSDRPVYKSA